MNIHLNNLTAKKEIEKGGESLKLFFDEIAHLIIRFGARVLSGDFNMAMWQVAGELLARGIQVNLAAWFPWQAEQEDAPRIDSEAIWIIGPCSGARLIFDSSILGVTPPHEDGEVEQRGEHHAGPNGEGGRARAIQTRNFQ